MTVNVIASEGVLGKAWSDYRSVSALEEGFEVFRKADKVPWSRTHTYFTTMGGFIIRFDENTRQAEEGVDPDASEPAPNNITETPGVNPDASYAASDDSKENLVIRKPPIPLVCLARRATPMSSM
jgi:hypothetical protein